MAIDYNSGISSLQTGAPDIKYTGDQGPRSPDQQLMASADPMLVEEYNKYVFEMEEQGLQPISFKEFIQQVMSGMAYGGTAKPTYTQSRKQRMANGGISQLVKPGPGRPGYGGPGSWFQENIKDPIEMAITGKTQADIDAESQARVDAQTAATGDPNYTPWYEQIFSPAVQQLTQDTASNFGLGDLAQNIGLGDITRLFGLENEQTGRLPLGADWMGLAPDSSLNPYLRRLTKEGVAAVPGTEGRFVTPSPNEPTQRVWVPGTTAQQAIPPEYETRLNPLYPIAGGLAAGAYAKAHPGPTLPAETAIGARNIDMAAAKRGDDLRFKLDPSVLKSASGGIARLAQGGRIGYQYGYGVGRPPRHRGKLRAEDFKKLVELMQIRSERLQAQREKQRLLGEEQELRPTGLGAAQGGRIGAQEGGLMNLGGMEKDYRQEGGFVPIGGQERADDVPARLSKNEFVFTADAVRAAGGGDIDAGAEVMENLMNNLEQGGQVSEESQGLEGARDMFATAQRLEGVM